MRFLIDAQLPPRLVATLRDAGHEAEHVFDVGLFKAPDIEIWRYAGRIGAAIVTKDSDFVAIRDTATGGATVVWLRFGNTTNEALERLLMKALPEIVTAVEANETLVEVR
ncbi:MAG TPA: DUF5615 family PIN-like protein [Rhizomicrobium sp.]|nr:DUF5615 family PIN-like protein [Rhizomicrobium sp.]